MQYIVLLRMMLAWRRITLQEDKEDSRCLDLNDPRVQKLFAQRKPSEDPLYSCTLASIFIKKEYALKATEKHIWDKIR